MNESLLPVEAPTAALTCGYSGLNTRTPFALTSRYVLNQTSARNLAKLARQVSLSYPKGTVHCPSADLSATVIAFSYPNRADVDLWFARSGCRYVANGKIQTGMDNIEPFARAAVSAYP